MKHLLLVALCAIGCESSQRSSTGSGAFKIDISALRQAEASAGFGQLTGVGLLVVRGQLAGLDEETQKLDTNAAAAEQETMSGSSTPTASGAGVEVNTTAGTMTTNTTTLPARSEMAADVKGALATPRLSDDKSAERVSAEDVPPVSYYPITLEPGANEFSIDLPAGRKQNLFLIGYAVTPASNGKPVPTYVAAALDATLAPQETTELVFTTYPAGVAIPQFLPPTKTGLTDASGTPITVLPSDMSCLAVATSDSPRPAFPPISLARVTMGSVAAQLANVGAAGLFVLPVGRYRLDCLAAFAGKLFGVDPNRPLVVDVAQGQISFPTAGLVKLRELTVIDPATGMVTAPGGATTLPGTDPGTMLPDGTDGTGASPGDTRFAIVLDQGGTPIARQAASGMMAPAVGDPTLSNLVNSSATSIAIVAMNPDGSFNSTANDLVRLEVRPAFNRTRWGTEKFTQHNWAPLQAAASAVKSIDVQLVDGYAYLPNALRTDVLSTIENTQSATFQYVITAQGYDASNRLLDRNGARYFTVRTDAACSVAVAQHVALFALGDELNELSSNLVAGVYTHPWANLLAVAVSADGGAVAGCAVKVTTSNFVAGMRMSSAADAGLEFPLGLVTRVAGTGFNDYVLHLPSATESQFFMRNGVRSTLAATASKPASGTVLGPLHIDVSVNGNPDDLSTWDLTLRIK